MAVELSNSDTIAIAAIIVAFFSTFMTFYFHSKQDQVNRVQKELNEKLLKKELNEEENNKKALISAKIYKQANNNYRVKVWNQGRVSARNIRIEFPQENKIIHPSELSRKLPYEQLEVHGSFDLLAMVYMGIPPKHEITLIWDDDFSDNNCSKCILSI